MFGLLVLFSFTFSEVYASCPEQLQNDISCDYNNRDLPSYAGAPVRPPPPGQYPSQSAYIAPRPQLHGINSDPKVTVFELQFLLFCPMGPFHYELKVLEDDGFSWLDDHIGYVSGFSESDDGRVAEGKIYHELRGSEYGDFGYEYEFKMNIVHNCGGVRQEQEIWIDDCPIGRRCSYYHKVAFFCRWNCYSYEWEVIKHRRIQEMVTRQPSSRNAPMITAEPTLIPK